MITIRSFTILLLISSSFFLSAQSELEIKGRVPFQIGETLKVFSSILEEERVINIYLPHGYSQNDTKKYPIIYLLDGSVDEDFIHIAGLVQFGSFSWINMLPESIIVGIANVDRKRDFTYPTQNKKDKAEFPTTGGSADFIHFLDLELLPLVEKTYKSDGQKTLIGQSLGGLLATEILFKNPDLFQNYIIASPSLWWDDESLLSFQPKGDLSQKSIYIGVGKEGKIMEQGAKALAKRLKRSPVQPKQLYFQFFKEQNHGDVLHLAVYDAFEKLFAATGKD